MSDFLAAVNTEAAAVTSDFITGIEFSGFNVEAIRAQALRIIAVTRLTIELSIVGAMRGNRPEDMDSIRLSNGQTLGAYLARQEREGNFHVNGEGGPKGRLTLARLSHAFAEAVVTTLKRIHDREKPLLKRFSNNRLPPYLEFMGAGALQLPEDLRREHRVFAQEFSEALATVGGNFDPALYAKMEAGATATTHLKLDRIRLQG